jgi:hypothetical protein
MSYTELTAKKSKSKSKAKAGGFDLDIPGNDSFAFACEANKFCVSTASYKQTVLIINYYLFK